MFRMNQMYRAFVFLIWVVSPSFDPRAARADEPADLCARGVVAGIEGTYVGSFDARTAIRLNLICIDETRVSAAVVLSAVEGGTVGTSTILGFGNSGMSDGDLIVATYGIKADERKGVSSKSSASYLRLNLDGLREGFARGVLVTPHGDHFHKLDLKRVSTYPRLAGSPAGTFPKAALTGEYRLARTPYGAAHLLVDVFGDTPVLTLLFSSGEGIHLLDGSAWDGGGLISSVTPQGDGEPDAHKLFYVRGKMVREGELELYFVTNLHGLEGPFRAVRAS